MMIFFCNQIFQNITSAKAEISIRKLLVSLLSIHLLICNNIFLAHAL